MGQWRWLKDLNAHTHWLSQVAWHVLQNNQRYQREILLLLCYHTFFFFFTFFRSLFACVCVCVRWSVAYKKIGDFPQKRKQTKTKMIKDYWVCLDYISLGVFSLNMYGLRKKNFVIANKIVRILYFGKHYQNGLGYRILFFLFVFFFCCVTVFIMREFNFFLFLFLSFVKTPSKQNSNKKRKPKRVNKTNIKQKNKNVQAGCCVVKDCLRGNRKTVDGENAALIVQDDWFLKNYIFIIKYERRVC